MFIVCVSMLSFLHEFIYTNPLSLFSRLTAWSVQNMVIACAILVLLRSTSIPFFFGECRLRLVYGFRLSELIIRRSPLPTPTPSGFTHKGFHSSESQYMEHQWRVAIRAINPRLLYSTTSAMLSPDYWTLEYSVIFDALHRITAGEIQEEDLEFTVWKQAPDNLWCACELWRMPEIMSDQQEVTMFKVSIPAPVYSIPTDCSFAELLDPIRQGTFAAHLGRHDPIREGR